MPRDIVSYPHDEAYASLVVRCGQGDPARVTSTLGLTPSRVSLAGESLLVRRPVSLEKYEMARRSRFVAKQNVWFYTSRGEVAATEGVEAHLAWLIERIGEKKPQLDALKSASLEVLVSCYWRPDPDHDRDAEVSEEMHSAFRRLDLEVWIDRY